MLKLAGMIFVMAGCCGYGYALCCRLKEHLLTLLTWKEIFLQVDAQRSYVCLPYPQILRKCARGKPEVFAEILEDAAGQMEDNQEADTKRIFCKVVSKREEQLCMTPEEQELVVELGRCLQIEGDGKKVSEMYFMQLEEKITQAMTERKEKLKLYQSVSIMAGIFFIILLF